MPDNVTKNPRIVAGEGEVALMTLEITAGGITEIGLIIIEIEIETGTEEKILKKTVTVIAGLVKDEAYLLLRAKIAVAMFKKARLISKETQRILTETQQSMRTEEKSRRLTR